MRSVFQWHVLQSLLTHFSQIVIVLQAKTALHCHVSAEEAVTAEAIASGVTSCVHIKAEQQLYSDGYITVVNNPSSNHPLFNDLPWLPMHQKVTQSGKVDPMRDNRRLDFGFGHQHNSRRRKRSSGASMSRCYLGTDDPWVKKLLSLLTTIVNSLGDRFGLPLYNDPERNEIFAESIGEGIGLEAVSCIVTAIGDNLLLLHTDPLNCQVYSHVINLTNFILVGGTMVRINIVVYARQANNLCLQKIKALRTMVAYGVHYFQHHIPPEAKMISKATIRKSEHVVLHFEHLDSMTAHCQPFALSIQLFLETHRVDNVVRAVAGLLMSALQVIHKPHFFFSCMTELVKNPSYITTKPVHNQDAFTYAVFRWFFAHKTSGELPTNIPESQQPPKPFPGMVRMDVAPVAPDVSFAKFVTSVNTLEMCSSECRVMQHQQPLYIPRNIAHTVSTLTAILVGFDGSPHGIHGLGRHDAHFLLVICVRLGLLPLPIATHRCMDPSDWEAWKQEFPSLEFFSSYELGSTEVMKAAACMMSLSGHENQVEAVLSKALFFKQTGNHRKTRDIAVAGVLNAWIEVKESSDGSISHVALWEGTDEQAKDAQKVRFSLELPTVKTLLPTVLGKPFFNAPYGRESVPLRRFLCNSKSVPLANHFQSIQLAQRRFPSLSLQAAANMMPLPDDHSICAAVEQLTCFPLTPVEVVRATMFSGTGKQKSIFRLISYTPAGLEEQYHCAGVRIPNYPEQGNTIILFPSLQYCLYPKFIGGTDTESKFSVVLKCKDDIDRRFFRGAMGRRYSMQFAATYLLHEMSGTFAGNAQARMLFSLPSEKLDTVHAKSVHSFAVFREGKAASPTNCSTLAGVRYNDNKKIPGGHGYFCVDGTGKRTSDVYIVRPPARVQRISQTNDPTQRSRVLGIQRHQFVSNKDPEYQNSSVNLTLVFDDGGVEDINLPLVTRDAPSLVYKYILQHSLSHVTPFKAVHQRLSSHCKDEVEPFPRVPPVFKTAKAKRKNRSRRQYRNTSKRLCGPNATAINATLPICRYPALETLCVGTPCIRQTLPSYGNECIATKQSGRCMDEWVFAADKFFSSLNQIAMS